VYEKKPRTTVDLKQNIREEVAAISLQHAATSDAELPETLRGNVLTTRDATSQTLYSGSECCN
jgi:hypothetical protein